MSESEIAPKAEDTAQNRNQALKLAIELGPLLVFAVVYAAANLLLSDSKHAIFWSTGAIMIATLLSLAASRYFLGHVAMMPLVTAALVMVFGGLTLYLQNDHFIKMKPTILYAFFSLALLIGLAMKRFFLKAIFSEVMKLTDIGWRILTIRWATFFAGLALLNEFVWRTFSEGTWVLFKFPGCFLLILVFAVAQVGLLKKHEVHG